LKPGDFVVGAFRGADATKVRPAVVLSSELYHRHRPDVIVARSQHSPRKNWLRQIANYATGDRWDFISRPSSGCFPSRCCSVKCARLGGSLSPIGLRFARASKRVSAATELAWIRFRHAICPNGRRPAEVLALASHGVRRREGRGMIRASGRPCEQPCVQCVRSRSAGGSSCFRCRFDFFLAGFRGDAPY
jgi:hypothetical protein